LTAYANMGRRERENFRQHVAEILNETDAAAAANYWRVRVASLALEPYGITLVANDRVLHVHREDRQEDRPRRQISGSVWDGRKPIWRTPRVTDHPHKLGKLTKGPKIRYAHRNRKSAEQMAAAKREPFKPRGDDAEAAHALLTAIGDLATPATKRARAFLDEKINEGIMARRDLFIGPPRPEPPPESAWFDLVMAEKLFRVGTNPLKQPDVSKDDLFKAAARLWNWQVNSRHREQMRIAWPQLAFHGACQGMDRSTPRAHPDDLGGECCRRTCGGMKTCPLQCWQRNRKD
jgi:hypothetical protein